MKIQVCVLHPKKTVENESIKLLQKHFDEVTIYTSNFYSFSDARNKCIDKTADFVIRFDSDEEIDENSIVWLKQDLPVGLVFAKFKFIVGDYTWIDGFKLFSHPTTCSYVGPAHEILVCKDKLKRIYDDNITLVHKKTEYDYYYSMARTYYLTVPDIELRRIIGKNMTVSEFKKFVKTPSKELKSWAEKQTACTPSRAFYYLAFGEMPNDCPLDLPNYSKIANSIYEKLKFFDPFLPYYVATHPQVDINRLAELNRIYMHILGRPIDQAAIETYYNAPNDKIINLLMQSILQKEEEVVI